MAISGTKYSTIELLLAHCADALNLLLWSQSDKKGKKPDSILQTFVDNKSREKVTSFRTAEEFERARNAILEGKAMECRN